MEWDYMIPYWDLAELEKTIEANIGAIAEPSRSLANQTNGIDCSVDLKLGGSEPPLEWKDQSRMAMITASSMSSPSKRARALSTASLVVSCSVDGCKADLSNCREYHRRHKVCEIHSKTSIVVVGGMEQRFCQQCSRFHLLEEFDEVKRSCRKRLDGHNRRRRKPRPDSATPPTMFPIQQGTWLSTFAQISQPPPTKFNWSGVVKAEQDAFHTHHPTVHFNKGQQHIPVPFSSYCKERKQFPFLQNGNTALNRIAIEPSVCQPLLNTAFSIECRSSSSKMSSDRLTRALDSDCALSLLSSPSQTSSLSAGQLLPASRITISRPLVSSSQHHGLNPYPGSVTSRNVVPSELFCSRGEGEKIGGVVVSDTDAGLRCQGIMFHGESEGSSDFASESLPFSW